jgi:hypothetical protein
MELAKPIQLGAAERVSYSPDGKRLAVRSSQVSVWDLEKGVRLWRTAPLRYLMYFAFSPDGKKLAVKSTTGQIAVVDSSSGKVLYDFRNRKDGEGCNLHFSPCGKFIVDGTWEGRLLVRAAATGKIEFERTFSHEMMNGVFAVNGGTSFLVRHSPIFRDDDEDVDAKVLPPYFTRWKWPFDAKPVSTVQLPDELFFESAVSPDGQLFAFKSSLVPKKPSIDILALSNGKRVASIPHLREERIKQLNWSADGNYLAVVKATSVVIYHAGKFEAVVEHGLDGASDVAFAPTADTIALGAKKATVVAWNQIVPSTTMSVATPKTRKTKSAVKSMVAPATSFIDSPEYEKAFKRVLSTLPSKSRIRKLLPDLGCNDEDRRIAANDVVADFDSCGASDDVRKPNWRLTEVEAMAILNAGAISEFPPPPPDAPWKDGYSRALGLLWRSPYPSLLPIITPAYEKQPRGMRRAALLALLGVLCTREAAAVFVACIRKFGWPPVYGRVWWELENLLAYGEVLLPEIALAAGNEEIGYLVDTITSALAGGTLPLAQVAGRLDALSPVVVTSIKKLIKQLSKYQTRKGISWRFDERYGEARYRLSSLLNIAGYLIDPKLPPLLREAAKFSDPLIAVSAAIAMLRQSGDANKAAFSRAAQSNETRAHTYAALAELKRKDLFPKKFATWEAFAASAMVDWLKYPTELGAEPDELKLEHTEWIDKRRKLVMYVWKFRKSKEPWLAAVSGPHELRGSPQPTHGAFTFSQFDEWDSATPQEHLEKCAGTAKEILENSNK